jgi:hypothetical protein
MAAERTVNFRDLHSAHTFVERHPGTFVERDPGEKRLDLGSADFAS